MPYLFSILVYVGIASTAAYAGSDAPLYAQVFNLLTQLNRMSFDQNRQCAEEIYQAITRPQERDQCGFIREALRHLPATGGVVKIPAGNYVCGAPIVLDRSHVTLRGEGNVNLRLGNHANSPLIIMGRIETPPARVEDVEISNLHLDGNKNNQDGECWGGECDHGGNTIIRNNGVTIRGVTNGRIESVSVTAARSGGLVTEKRSTNLVVNNFSSRNNFFDGIGGCETTNSRFSNLNLSHNNNAGISLDLSFNNNVFQNVIIQNSRDVGIFMRHSNGNHFDQVRIQHPGNFGVFVASSDRAESCASNNEFIDLGVSDSPRAAFRLANVCAGNRLAGHSFFSNTKGCLSTADGAHLDVSGPIVCD